MNGIKTVNLVFLKLHTRALMDSSEIMSVIKVKQINQIIT